MNLTALPALAAKHGIRLILQFGSSVTGATHSRSDLDIAVLLDRSDLSLAEYGDLSHALQEALPGKALDLAVLNRADPLFLHQIVSRCRPLYDPEGRLPALKLYAFKRYQDHERFFELERQYVARFVARVRAAG
ncbi:MAG: nucleotidyltransferase domain-containing protein [Candidatus Methylomirabilales bacterium]